MGSLVFIAHILAANLDPEISAGIANIETWKEESKLVSSVSGTSSVIQKEVLRDFAEGKFGTAGIPSHGNAVKGGPIDFYT